LPPPRPPTRGLPGGGGGRGPGALPPALPRDHPRAAGAGGRRAHQRARLTMPRDPSVFVHEKGLCESDDVGARTRVWAFAHVMRGATVGADCNIGDHAFIESGARIGNRVTVKNAVLIWDGVTIEDEVFLGPNMVFTNVMAPRAAVKRPRTDFMKTWVRRGSSIGANATILCGITIGENALIGAGATVVRDVAPHA